MKFCSLIASAAAVSDRVLFAQWKASNNVHYKSSADEAHRFAQWLDNKVSWTQIAQAIYF